jgi:hypothetical protein
VVIAKFVVNQKKYVNVNGVEKMKKIDRIIKKYKSREKQRYEFTPIREIISDLEYIKPKKRRKSEDKQERNI